MQSCRKPGGTVGCCGGPKPVGATTPEKKFSRRAGEKVFLFFFFSFFLLLPPLNPLLKLFTSRLFHDLTRPTMGVDYLECDVCGSTFADCDIFDSYQVRGFHRYYACKYCGDEARGLLLPSRRRKGEFLVDPLSVEGGEPSPRCTFPTSAKLRAFLRDRNPSDGALRLGFCADGFSDTEREAWIAGGELERRVGGKLQWFEGENAFEEMQSFRSDPDRVDFDYDDDSLEWILNSGSKIEDLKREVAALQLQIEKLESDDELESSGDDDEL